MGNTIHCKFCGSDNTRQDGSTDNYKDRYECACCGRHFRLGDDREKIDLQTKLLITLLYSSKSMSIADIAKNLGVSRVSVHNCIKDALGRFDEPITSLNVKKVEPMKILGEINRIERNFIASQNQDNKTNEWAVFDFSTSSKVLGILLLKKTTKEK